MKKGFLIFLFVGLFVAAFFAQAAIDRDSKIKASLIYKFAHTIEWKNPKELTDFRIGLLGANENVVKELMRITNRKREGKFLIRIITFKSIAEVSQTEVLFVDFAKFRNFSLSDLKGHTLLITDNNLDLSNSMLAFIEGNRKLTFELNKENINNAGLKLTGGFVGLAKKTIRVSDDNMDDFDLEEEASTSVEIPTVDNQNLTTSSASSVTSDQETETRAARARNDKRKSAPPTSSSVSQEAFLKREAEIKRKETEINSQMTDVLQKKKN